MKRIGVLLLAAGLLSLLAGCTRFVEAEYTAVRPHAEQRQTEEDQDVLTAENYLSLKNAILDFVEAGEAEGVIHIYDYSGDVEEDLAEAVYEVLKKDPLGAYAVDFIDHDSTQIVSYYEIRLRITYRRTPEQVAAIRRVGGTADMSEQIGQIMAQFGDELALRLSYYNDQDIAGLVREYYDDHPTTAMELPEVTVNIYPESGYVRIVELFFSYNHTAEELLEMQTAAAAGVHAAAEYVRYRDTEPEKLQLLYTYLLEHFVYEQQDTATPIYSFLCDGVAGSEGCAKSFQLICDRVGLECHTVEGSRGGEPYRWNIVCIDGVYRHVDLLPQLLEGSESIRLLSDGEMTEYFWDAEGYPVCEETVAAMGDGDITGDSAAGQEAGGNSESTAGEPPAGGVGAPEDSEDTADGEPEPPQGPEVPETPPVEVSGPGPGSDAAPPAEVVS